MLPTPSLLASEDIHGIVQFSTVAAQLVGTETDKASTPAGVKALVDQELANVDASVDSGSTTVEGIWEAATQTEYDDGDTDRVVTSNLQIIATKLKGLIVRNRLPDEAVGNPSFRVSSSASSINAAKSSPVIANVLDVSSDGQVVLGTGAELPVLVIGFVASGGGNYYVYPGGVFANLRLHPSSDSNVYTAGEIIKLRDDFSGFSKTSGSDVGIVRSLGSSAGRYDVALDLWPPFIQPRERRIFSGTSDSPPSTWQSGDIYAQREA